MADPSFLRRLMFWNRERETALSEDGLRLEFKNDEVNALLSDMEIDSEARERVLLALINLHDRAREDELRAEARLAFLSVARLEPRLLERRDLVEFVLNETGPEDFSFFAWKQPEHVFSFCELLLGFSYETPELAERVASHLKAIASEALREMERKEQWEELFRLLQLMPSFPLASAHDLQRIRHRVYLREEQKVRRRRRALHAYLLLHGFFVLLLAPYLFIYAENGALQRAIENTADVDVGTSEPKQFLGYRDGVYWSIITAGSIGYGDITPRSTVGRALAATLGTSGVITIGVIAGLLLGWITPRRFD